MIKTDQFFFLKGFCKECRRVRLDEEAFDLLSFENSTIYVQKLTESDQHNYTVDESCKTINSEEETNTDDIEISVTTMKSSFKQMVGFYFSSKLPEERSNVIK